MLLDRFPGVRADNVGLSPGTARHCWLAMAGRTLHLFDHQRLATQEIATPLIQLVRQLTHLIQAQRIGGRCTVARCEITEGHNSHLRVTPDHLS